MESRTARPRRTALIAAALILGVGLTSCSGNTAVGRSPAATANGVEISEQQVLDSAKANKAFRQLQLDSAEASRLETEASGEPTQTAEELAAQFSEQFGEALQAYRGDGPDTYGAEGAAIELSGLIRTQVWRKALADSGAKVTDEQRTAARTDIEGQITQSGVAPDDVPQILVDNAIEITAIRAAIQADAGPSDSYDQTLRNAYEQQKETFAQVCLRGVVTDDEATAAAALDRVRAGEDMGAVSTETSTEPQVAEGAGELGCFDAASLAQSFDESILTAEPGALYGPIASEEFWIAVEVTELTVPSFEEVREQLAQTVPDNSDAASQDAYEKALSSIEVTIDPRYGTWDPTFEDQAGPLGQVLPPVSPAVPSEDF